MARNRISTAETRRLKLPQGVGTADENGYYYRVWCRLEKKPTHKHWQVRDGVYYSGEWTSREKVSRKNSKRHSEKKYKAFEVLGGECKECKEDDFVVLEIDHIKKIGCYNRKMPIEIYNEIIGGCTENVQLLCANCHKRKTKNEPYYSENYLTSAVQKARSELC